MTYSVYTDAATQHSTGLSNTAFLVLCGNNHIHTHSKVLQANDSAVAESVAMGLALRYVCDVVNLTKEDKVVFHSDSLYVIKFCKRCMQRKNPENKNVVVCRPVKNDHLCEIFDYIEKLTCELRFVWIKSHTPGKSPNSYVDRLAKSGLD